MRTINHMMTMVLFLSGVGFSIGQDEQATETKEILWLTFEEAHRLNEIAPKRWVIDISTSWCGWCKKMDRDTFSDSLIVEFVSDNFYAVALDGEYKNEIKVGEQTFKFVEEGRRGYHELPAALMGGKMSYPTIVFLDDQMRNLSPLPGYKGPKDFMALLEYFNEYHPEDNPIVWEEFNETYVSPYKKEN